MDKHIRKLQVEILKAFSSSAGPFALAGGTALELFYLNHRFSADLDFFSAAYNNAVIENIISHLKKKVNAKIKLTSEILLPGNARARFYSVQAAGSGRFLKIDFVEDVLLENPKPRHFNKIPVYAVENIYYQKVAAVTGSRPIENEIGREVITGRNAARDVFDIYCLSVKVKPLHTFLKSMPLAYQRGMVNWYQSFSRQDLKLSLLDLDIYDKDFNSRILVTYLEKEIKKFISEVLA